MENNLIIEEKDLKFIKEYLKDKKNPIHLEEISQSLAFFKTEKNRTQKVKIYDPCCEFKVNDLIYKEYSGKLPVGSKKSIELGEGNGVVLKVIEVRTKFKDEIKLTYEGTSDYKKYIDYLKRQKIELLLPHKQKKPCKKVEYVEEENDPRIQYAPLLQRDFNILKKKLVAILIKRSDIAFTGQRILMVEHLKPVDKEVFDKIRDFLKENGKAESSEFFVENFLKISPKDKDFESYCFSLNYRMNTDYKIDFQQVNFKGWGKWNLISVIYYLKKNSIINEQNPLLNKIEIEGKKGLAQKRKKFEEDIFDNNHNRYFLSQREISAGALRLRHPIPEMAEFEEINLVDENSKKNFIAYYYADSKLLLGLDEIYNSYKVIQGAIFTISEYKENTLYFNIRITKKGTISTKIKYNDEQKSFFPKEEKIASQVFVNKSMYLEPGVLSEIAVNVEYYRNSKTLKELILKVFMDFGVKERNSEIHILQLYHILDLIFPIKFNVVADMILGSDLFIPSEKLNGVFYMDISLTEKEIYDKGKIEQETLGESINADDTLPENKPKEISAKDETKKLREERKRKREDEMMRKEQLEKERESEKIRKFGARKPDDSKKYEKTEIIPKKIIDETFDKPRKKSIPAKKSSKTEFREKEVKSIKKTTPKPLDDQLDIEDLKSEIELLKLKEKVEKGRKTIKKKDKKKEVAFKDDGKNIGGLLASKLDEIVKSEKKKKEKK